MPKIIPALLTLTLVSQAVSAQDFCSIAQSLIIDGQVRFARISEGKDTSEPLRKFRLPGAAECFLATTDKDHEIGALTCIWKFSKFTEEGELKTKAQEMLDGFEKCYETKLIETDSSVDGNFRGRLKGTGNASKQGVGDWIEITTVIEADDDRTITLYFDVNRYS